MKSTKSESDLRVKRTPKLSRLITGKASYDLTTEDDLPYLWAAYKLGELSRLHEVFSQPLDKEDFRAAIDWYIAHNQFQSISFYYEKDGKRKMIGFGLFWVRGRIFQTADLIWFSWASNRIILENYVNLVNNMRKKIHEETNLPFVILEFAMEKDRKYFDHVCSYGVMRRVGTSEEIYNDGKCCVYESRSLKDAK